MKVHQLIAEVVAALRGRWLTAVLISFVSAVAIAIVLVTVGRSAALSAEVQSQLASDDSRTIVIHASPTDGLEPRLVEQLSSVAGVTWAVALGPSFDVTNEALPEIAPVSARRAWMTSWKSAQLPEPLCSAGVSGAWATSTALQGLSVVWRDEPDVSVRTSSGARLAVLGQWDIPSAMRGHTGDVLIPTCSATTGPVSSVVVLADSPESVGPLLHLVRSLLPEPVPASVTIKSELAKASSSVAVAATLNDYSRSAIVATMAASAVAVAVLQVGIVVLRRRDFGRRRALGATRKLLIALVVTDTAITSSVGCVAGSIAATCLLVATGGVLPAPSLGAALIVLLIFGTTAVSVVPAVLAARLDPSREMRAP